MRDKDIDPRKLGSLALSKFLMELIRQRLDRGDGDPGST